MVLLIIKNAELHKNNDNGNAKCCLISNGVQNISYWITHAYSSSDAIHRDNLDIIIFD